MMTITGRYVPATSTTKSFSVSQSCLHSLARTSGSPACSAVDFTEELPVCELRTLADTSTLGYIAGIAGAIEVILWHTYKLI